MYKGQSIGEFEQNLRAMTKNDVLIALKWLITANWQRSNTMSCNLLFTRDNFINISIKRDSFHLNKYEPSFRVFLIVTKNTYLNEKIWNIFKGHDAWK